MVTAYLPVFVNGKQVDTMYPAKWYFRRHENEPTTETAIRRTFAEDLYIVMAARPELQDQSANLQITLNPLVNWIWLGFGIMALGTGIALLPERSYSFALAKLPAEAAATTTAAFVLAIVLLGAAPAFAQHAPASSASTDVQNSYYARTPLERQLQHEIVCTCGSCGHANIGECRKDACATSHKMRGELAALIDQGKTHDQIIQWFVTSYGSQEMLGAPINKGFNRLAWLFPYLVGGVGAVAIGFAAVRWTRRPEAAPETPAPIDAELDERITDELRDLD
jgi:cytochrome c-type biogenesis protein CcmF